MKIRVAWQGFYTQEEVQIDVTDVVDVEAASAIEALNASRTSIIEKLARGSKYGLSAVNLHLLEGEAIGLLSMDALNDFLQSFNAEGATDSTKRIREKGYTVTWSPDGTTNIQSGNKLV